MRAKPLVVDRWKVVALYDERGGCPTEDALRDHPLRAKMFSIFDRAAALGPMNLTPHQTRGLGDGIFEFRCRPGRGAHLRVLWFYDDNRIVVCTHAFTKARAKTPAREIDRVRKMRTRYQRKT